MLKIKVSPAAKMDIQLGVSYYNKQQAGLGRKFEAVLKSTLKKIQQMPQSASFAFDEVRYKTTPKFPYIILYKFEENHLSVIRVFNTFLDDGDL